MYSGEVKKSSVLNVKKIILLWNAEFRKSESTLQRILTMQCEYSIHK